MGSSSGVWRREKGGEGRARQADGRQFGAQGGAAHGVRVEGVRVVLVLAGAGLCRPRNADSGRELAGSPAPHPATHPAATPRPAPR